MIATDEILEKLVTQYTEDMFNWAFHKTSSTEIAEDLVQDSFLAAAENISGFKGESTAKTWLFSILNHKIIDYYRKKANKNVSFDNETLSTFFDEDGIWQNEKRPNLWDEQEINLLDDVNFLIILKKCLDALPEKWNTSVKLKYLSGKKGELICKELGITPTNFWQTIHRAKLKLRECIESNWLFN